MATDYSEYSITLSLDTWKSLILNKQWDKAIEEAQSVIDRCKSILKGIKSGEDPSKRSEALIFGILFRSFQDFTDLCKITESAEFNENHDLIEKAWTALCDCKQRIEYAASCCTSHDVIEWIFGELEKYQDAFHNAFGPGIYFSPEILIEKETCNICGQDFRACNHISGVIYDGVRCFAIPKDIQLINVSFVEYPTDLRCRAWPWQVKDDNIVSGYILTTFSMDDFLYK